MEMFDFQFKKIENDICGKDYDIYLPSDCSFIFEIIIWLLLAIFLTKWLSPILIKLNLNWKKIVGLQFFGYLIIRFSSLIPFPYLLEVIIFEEYGKVEKYGEFMGYVFCQYCPFIRHYYLECALSWIFLVVIPALYSWKMRMHYYIIPLAIFLIPILLLAAFYFILFFLI